MCVLFTFANNYNYVPSFVGAGPAALVTGPASWATVPASWGIGVVALGAANKGGTTSRRVAVTI